MSTTPPLADIRLRVTAACDRIAPTWPLDQFIAVNPYWGWRREPIGTAAARLATLAGTPLTMPRSWFRTQWHKGRLSPDHLAAAARVVGDDELAQTARSMLEATIDPQQPPLVRAATMADLRDQGPGPVPGQTWTDLIVHQISQHCASHVDDWQATWSSDRSAGLFATWRIDPSVTHGFRWHRGRAWARRHLDTLPAEPLTAIGTMLMDLGVAERGYEAYLTALLLSVNGWAAWCAYLRWQARLVDGDDRTIEELLAIRLAWEWLLAADAGLRRERLAAWAESWSLLDDQATQTADDQRVDWVMQTALERTYQDTLIAGFPAARPPDAPPEVQAVFCIDVRSEVFRRCLEATSSTVRTRGFAGFFGLPIAYNPVGSALSRPQLPGLLAPSLAVTDVSPTHDQAELTTRRTEVLQNRQKWQRFRSSPASMFSYVETLGLLSSVKLIKRSVPHEHPSAAWERDGLGSGGDGLRPRLALVDDDPGAAAAIGHRVLTAMGLVDGFAPLVMLCGHGSSSVNNPHAAGLDCGACGGQSGEVNSRVLADLLNASAVRRGLAELGVEVPDSTWFVPAVHDTTTDTVTLFDTELAPLQQRERIAGLAGLLAAAGGRARAERAPALGLDTSDPTRLARHVKMRADDWSQTRPEWGLAGNAAIVIAPRWRTSHLDLAGRCFLHDYDWRNDPDHSVLTLIMTAPMVVTNWINLQYYASTVDNRRYGSGDKTLHNVVAGHVGVFEGNGGDLRIGLSMQSLHDGHVLRHIPLRLSVFIEAPQAAIDAVIDAEPVARELVTGGWVHLLRIDTATGAVERRTATSWDPAVPLEAPTGCPSPCTFANRKGYE